MRVIRSIRELARRVRRSHSTVSEWTKRGDWPFPPAPPWHDELVPAIVEWAEELQADRAKHRPDIVGFSDVMGVITPGCLQNPAAPFFLLPKLGPERYQALTVADLDSLARHLSGALWMLVYDALDSAGADMPTEAPREFYTGLISRLFDEREQQAVEALSKALAGWMADRFPATPKAPKPTKASKARPAKR